MGDVVRCWHRGELLEIVDVPATTTVLAWLRTTRRSLGTREGCNEGDCGACAVVVGRPDGSGGLELSMRHACTMLVPMLHGLALVTVEDLAEGDRLHPVQQAMVDGGGSQCGFCTPGIVMSLWRLHHDAAGRPVEPEEVRTALAGHICRCTGYRSIVEAAEVASAQPGTTLDVPAIVAALAQVPDDDPLDYRCGGTRFVAPVDVAGLVAARRDLPEARLIAGGTDLLPDVPGRGELPPGWIGTSRVSGYDGVDERGGVLAIGGGASIETAWAALSERWPTLTAGWLRFASPPIREAGTLAGNLVTGSPVGDSAPLLLALGARVVLVGPDGERPLDLADLYVGYRQTALGRDEVVARVEVPLVEPRPDVRMSKVARRFDNDIATVSAAFALGRGERGGHVGAHRVRRDVGGAAASQSRGGGADRSGMGSGRRSRRDGRGGRGLPADGRRSRVGGLPGAGGPGPDRALVAADPTGGPAPGRPDRGLGARMTSGAVVGRALPDESAVLHVTGAAEFVDDIPEPAGTLHAALVLSPVARGRVVGYQAHVAHEVPGVVGVVTGHDVPGENNCGTIVHDEPVLAVQEVTYLGQPILAVVATDDASARAGAARVSATLTVEEDEPVLDFVQAHRDGQHVIPPMRMERQRDLAAALASAPHRLQGTFQSGAQEHFYLETQASLAIPLDDGGYVVHSSTQHPTEVQKLVAGALGLSANHVRCLCRRMGGGFGGKESQAAQGACIAAVAAHLFHRPVKVRLDRGTDDLVTGKRHAFWSEYDVGFDERRSHPRPRRHAGLAGRPQRGPVGAGADARDVPRGQRVLAARGADQRVRGADECPERHGLPRVRRAAGSAGDRAARRVHRPAARARSARGAAGQPVRAGSRRHPVRRDRRGQRAARADRRPRLVQRLPPSTGGDRGVQPR